MELMSHWQFIGCEMSEVGQQCLSAVRNMEDGKLIHSLISTESLCVFSLIKLI